MLIDQINLNHVRIFETVFRTGSMTLAAQELSLTQSGVSQHIKSLEDVLDIQLFDRINQRLVPTAQAVVLYENCNLGLMNIEKALSQVTGRDTQLSGTVSIGMPIEFGINLVMPRLAEFAKKNPFIKYKLRLDFANEMNEGLLRGDIDFAFVDEFTMDRRITVEKVYDECLELCIGTDLLKEREKKLGSKLTRQFFEGLDYLD
ncbi:MAG: LysR family transcriptional regulator, partial [Bdellovibrionales bacterium]|nr:LysR family transcriptional regulator [Bdellovibrionales bacterium]